MLGHNKLMKFIKKIVKREPKKFQEFHQFACLLILILIEIRGLHLIPEQNTITFRMLMMIWSQPTRIAQPRKLLVVFRQNLVQTLLKQSFMQKINHSLQIANCTTIDQQLNCIQLLINGFVDAIVSIHQHHKTIINHTLIVQKNITYLLHHACSSSVNKLKILSGLSSICLGQVHLAKKKIKKVRMITNLKIVLIKKVRSNAKKHLPISC